MCAQSTCSSTGGCVATQSDADPHSVHLQHTATHCNTLQRTAVWCWSTFRSSSPLSSPTIPLLSVSLRLFGHSSFVAGFFWRESRSPNVGGGQSQLKRETSTGNMGNTCSPLCSRKMFPEHVPGTLWVSPRLICAESLVRIRTWETRVWKSSRVRGSPWGGLGLWPRRSSRSGFVSKFLDFFIRGIGP